ncbi:MAG: phosphoribosylanthranilate isomerase [Vicinamibacterales bacterium]
MTAIKICGITRLADAEAAAALGASYVGFVLWPGSPRAATLETVRRIVPAMPQSVTPVGVFVDPTPEDVKAAAAAGIRMAQVHSEAPVFLRGVTIPIVRAVHLAVGREDGVEPDIADELVVLDAHDPVKHGGTGKTVDWRRAARIARVRRVILAGGLTPDNVHDAIAEVKPYAVDVASGVESQPGVKDHARLQAFFAAVKESL